jgi:hypothetical protein
MNKQDSNISGIPANQVYLAALFALCQKGVPFELADDVADTLHQEVENPAYQATEFEEDAIRKALSFLTSNN